MFLFDLSPLSCHMGYSSELSSQILHLVYTTFSKLSPFSAFLFITAAESLDPSLKTDEKFFITPVFKSPCSCMLSAYNISPSLVLRLTLPFASIVSFFKS